MDILFAILAITGFVVGIISIGISAYSHAALRSRMQVDMAEMKVYLSGIESRIESALNQKQEQALINIRQAAQSDALELIQNTLTAQADLRDQGISMANFNNFGE